MYGDNLPDGFSREDAIAAGIEERVPGFERYFEMFIEEMEEDYYSLPLMEQERIYEDEMENFRREQEEARAEMLMEQAEYDATHWDGYEPW